MTWYNQKSRGEKLYETDWYNPLLLRLGAVEDVDSFDAHSSGYTIQDKTGEYYAINGKTGAKDYNGDDVNALINTITSGTSERSISLGRGTFGAVTALTLKTNLNIHGQGPENTIIDMTASDKNLIELTSATELNDVAIRDMTLQNNAAITDTGDLIHVVGTTANWRGQLYNLRLRNVDKDHYGINLEKLLYWNCAYITGHDLGGFMRLYSPNVIPFGNSTFLECRADIEKEDAVPYIKIIGTAANPMNFLTFINCETFDKTTSAVAGTYHLDMEYCRDINFICGSLEGGVAGSCAKMIYLHEENKRINFHNLFQWHTSGATTSLLEDTLESINLRDCYMPSLTMTVNNLEVNIENCIGYTIVGAVGYEYKGTIGQVMRSTLVADATLSGTNKILTVKDADGTPYYVKMYPTKT